MDDERAQLLAEELRLAVGHLVRRTRAHADELSAGRAETLGQLDRDGAQTIAQLAAARGVRHQAMSRTVAELEDLELVQRGPSATDGRASVISLSDRGRRALQRDRDARRGVLAASIARLSPAEQEALASVPGLLRKLAPEPASQE